MPKESKCCLLAVSAIISGGFLVSGTSAKGADAGSLAREVTILKESVRSTNTRLQRVEEEVSRLGGKSLTGSSGTPVSYDKSPRAGGTSSTSQTSRHTVARGDTLSSISRQYRVGVDRLVAANRFDDPHRLRIGQEVLVPGSAVSPPARESKTSPPAPAPSRSSPASAGGYTVRSGDTLSSIARAHDTSVREIMTLNQIADAHVLKIGQQLKVPGATGAPARRDSPPAPAPPSSASKGGGTDLGSAAPSGEVEAPDGHGWYQVEKGDTLHSISLSFGTTTRVLRSLNEMKSDELRIGQYLLVPVSDESLYES